MTECPAPILPSPNIHTLKINHFFFPIARLYLLLLQVTEAVFYCKYNAKRDTFGYVRERSSADF